MARPVIISVDDDPAVLSAVERDLRKKYGRDYRILKSDSGAAAIESLKQLQLRNEAVALFIADQRMPEMTGVQFLGQAGAVYPEAKKVLLTAYADTEAAITAINRVGLDHYLMKPWDPPDEHLYPVLDDLLEDWKAHVRLPYEGIRVAGALWSLQSHEVKDFLARHQIAYQWLDVESDSKARALVEDYNKGQLKIPAVFFPDGTVLVEPTTKELAAKVGLKTQAALPFYDFVIVGGGPAGLAAAVYGSSDGLKCLLIERQAPGGQAGNSPKIENYMGFPQGLSGGDLARRAVTQARRFGTEIISAQAASKVRVQDKYRVVAMADGSEVSCHVVLIATGASFHTLDCPGAAELAGAGVYYGAAHTEAFYYKDQDVFVIGGANSAAQGAIFLTRFARKVTVMIRGAELTASQYLVDEIKANEKIEIVPHAEIVELHGQGRLEETVIKNNATGEMKTLPGAAMFVFIGARPHSDVVSGLVMCDEKGAILTGPDLTKDGKRPRGWPLDRDPFILETNVPGIFAAGDVRHGSNSRVASAAGEGGMAVALTWQYLKTI
ncbi:MAG: FAD-dependent oxidoreductase [Chloroflexi bacterium]|nr:FAD-dependent oxidoreductase [Chloroflexota bacterium]